MKKIVFVVWFGLIACFIFARKEFKEINTFLKAKNYAQAAAAVEKCKKDSAVMNDPQLYLLGAEVQRKLNDQQNMKLYLKQAYDTIAFFSTINGIYTNMLKCYDLENTPDEKGKIKAKDNGKIKSTLKKYYDNLFSAGLFYMKKKKYAEADNFFSLYINMADHPLFVADSLMKFEQKMPRGAFWSMASCYSINKYQEVFKFEDLAMRDTANIGLCLQYKAMSYAALKKYPEMVRELKIGVNTQGQDLFFFSHLTDYYNSIKDFKSSMALCDSLIHVDSTKVLYKFGKAVIYFNMQNYDKCIDLSKWVITRDTTNVDAYFYLASSYYNLATYAEDKINPDINSKTYNQEKSAVKDLYQKGLFYMEKYRTLRPNDIERWSGPLYRIYLSLNMGPQFAEMEQLLKKIESEKADAAAKQKK